MTSNAFELRIERNGRKANLAVYQILSTASGQKTVRVGSMPYSKLPAVADMVLPALRKAGHKVTDLNQNQVKSFALEERDGLLLGLLFVAIAPLSRLDRIDVIAKEIDSMSTEEANYWISKCTRNGRAQKALRILLAA